ncbi:DUF4829 domain-containing protein [Tissierellaceae bacterium HCP3S3_D8]
MRRIVISFFILLLVFSLVSCKESSPADNLIIDIEESTKFTEEEITEAIDRVKDNFDFPACTLTKVWYDKEKSDSLVTMYLENGKGLGSGIKPENVIVLLSNFDVDGSGDNPVLNPNSTYEDYQWILIRDSEASNWVIDDWGY